MSSKKKIESYVSYVDENITVAKITTLLELTSDLKSYIDLNLYNSNHGLFIIVDNILNKVIALFCECLINPSRKDKLFSEIKDQLNSLPDFIEMLSKTPEELKYENTDFSSNDEENCEEDEDKINFKIERDQYGNFRWGGLSGEEAYDAYWNNE